MKPRQSLKVPVKIDGLTGEKAYVTLAAVDVGILNLTGYQPPEPETYYYGQKRLLAGLYDIYGQLIDGMGANRGPIRTGGDSGAGNFHSPPPTQAPLALFSGIVEVAADGTAEVPFDIPAFNGTIRVMAVAWTATKVGHASVDVIARDPVVIAGTLPRFLGSGDQSRWRLDLLNAEAVAGDYTLTLTIEGPVGADPNLLQQTVKIGAVGLAPAGQHSDHRFGHRHGPAYGDAHRPGRCPDRSELHARDRTGQSAGDPAHGAHA